MIPKQYRWLSAEPGPKMIVEALKHYGLLERRGPDNNPDISAWAKEIGGNVEKVYTADEIPWCGLFMAICAKRSGKVLPKDPLWALNWGTFGIHTDTPMLGDVLVYIRKTSEGKKAGHVNLYVGEDDNYYHGIGGNQSDGVNITRIAKDRLYASRSPLYSIQPSNVRVIHLSPVGEISTKEA